jgi:peptidylprolyl isomerase/peptidyl-prolyl cis-trans isomerase C
MQYSYLELKLAWELFQKTPEMLVGPEQKRLLKVAARQKVIEQRILASAEAAHVVVPAPTLATRLDEIRQRYPSGDELAQDLERIGLHPADLEKAVERDLRVEAVLEKIACTATPASAVDAEIYYRLHPEAFERPEARRLRHILITCDNAPEKARARLQLETLRPTLRSAEQFAEAALRLSQCPTALQGGQLGAVKRQQLYPELEPAAFALSAGEISAVLESPIGVHLVRCDEVFAGGLLPFTDVCARIIERLTDKHRREAQTGWIKSLSAR